jgi:hypothetical protein
MVIPCQSRLFALTPLPTGWAQRKLLAATIALATQLALLLLQLILSFAAIRCVASWYVISLFVGDRMIAMASAFV